MAAQTLTGVTGGHTNPPRPSRLHINGKLEVAGQTWSGWPSFGSPTDSLTCWSIPHAAASPAPSTELLRGEGLVRTVIGRGIFVTRPDGQ